MKMLTVFLLFILSFSVLAEVDPAISPKVTGEEKEVMQKFCKRLNKDIKKYYWGKIICNPKTWYMEKEFVTPGGWPLVYRTFDTDKKDVAKSTTLITCGIHGDELPTVYLCVHLIRDILFDNKNDYLGQHIVVAPILNPDGFFRKRPTRQNGRGVDLNRNFPTKDFDKKALRDWKKKYKSTPRKYPGKTGGSEIETQFTIHLIEKYRPDKIIALHSPYGWLDFDSPSKNKSWDEPDGYDFRIFKRKTKKVAKTMSKKSDNYPLTSFRIYPGSLGNYAANERSIPVYTLELPTSGAEKAYNYWRRMRKGIVAAVQSHVKVKK